MFVNGVGLNETKASYASKTGFLSKFTLPYYGEITVRYYLILAAFMTMPRSTDNTAKFERVEQIISEVCSYHIILIITYLTTVNSSAVM